MNKTELIAAVAEKAEISKKDAEKAVKAFTDVVSEELVNGGKIHLKVSRIIKRRTVANEACDSGRVMLNDKVARASAEVKAGDVIEIAFGNKSVKVRVTSVQETIRKEDAKEMFEYL